MQKNGLGQLCLLAGICFSWNLAHRNHSHIREVRATLAIDVMMLAMAAWLLTMANSATSLFCLIISVGIICASRVPSIAKSPRRILNVGLLLALVVAMLETIFDIRGAIISGLGRDQTLTTRVPMWKELLATVSNPWIGRGYEVFWATNDGKRMSQEWAGIFQAHNGYLEMYLNLGILGVTTLLMGIVSGLLKVRRYFTVSYSAAVLRLILIVVVVLINWTEASFRSRKQPSAALRRVDRSIIPFASSRGSDSKVQSSAAHGCNAQPAHFASCTTALRPERPATC